MKSTPRRVRTGVLLVAVMLALVLGIPSSIAGAQNSKPTISVTAADLNAGTVEITNHGDAEVDVNGLILCNFPAYGAIADAPPIAPGETITVDSGAAGVPLDPTTGEMGIYTAPEYENPDAIITYVEWGAPGHQRAPVAVAAGVWTEGTAEVVDGFIVASVDNPISPDDWVVSTQDTETAGDEADTTELAQTGTETTFVLVTIAAVLVLGGLMFVGFNRRRTI
ncbi:MAG: LPXTG cell wall anchor domain-containing protein [Acidimicrobiales bacterium]